MDEYPVPKEGDDPGTFKALKAIRIQFYLNSALVQLKTNLATDAITSCTRALEMDGADLSTQDMAKAYYRRGQAHGKANEDESAIEDLNKALELNPGDPGIITELNAARQRQRVRKEKLRKAYSKMFS